MWKCSFSINYRPFSKTYFKTGNICRSNQWHIKANESILSPILSSIITLFFICPQPPSSLNYHLPSPLSVLTQHSSHCHSIFCPSLSFSLSRSLCVSLSFPWQHLFMAAVACFKFRIPMIVKTGHTWAYTGMYTDTQTQEWCSVLISPHYILQWSFHDQSRITCII